nr:serine/threonine protein kinase [Streptomyces sp. TLI_55]
MASRYRLVESIGQGGMGRVWRAADEMLDRQVAVKEMRIDGLDAEDARTRRERTLREARATARIDHPNVVRIYDVVDEGECLWIVMELVAGRSLERMMAEDGPLGPREAARIGIGLVTALRQVHARGVLHRDIKPGNVLVEGAGHRVVLTDFGIAAIQDAKALTMVGMLVGSPDYMAPERIAGRPQGPPSDIWSLGATLCAALGGDSPFSRDTTLATLHAVLYEEPELPPTVGPLRDILAALLEKEPELRPGLDELEEALHPTAFPAPTPTVVVGGQEEPEEREQQGEQREEPEGPEATGSLGEPGALEEFGVPGASEELGEFGVAEGFGPAGVPGEPGEFGGPEEPVVLGEFGVVEGFGPAGVPGELGEFGGPEEPVVLGEFGVVEGFGPAGVPGEPGEFGAPEEPVALREFGAVEGFGEPGAFGAPPGFGVAEEPEMPREFGAAEGFEEPERLEEPEDERPPTPHLDTPTPVFPWPRPELPTPPFLNASQLPAHRPSSHTPPTEAPTPTPTWERAPGQASEPAPTWESAPTPPPPTHEPAPADVAQPPQGPPAPDHESRTGGAGGKQIRAEGPGTPTHNASSEAHAGISLIRSEAITEQRPLPAHQPHPHRPRTRLLTIAALTTAAAVTTALILLNTHSPGTKDEAQTTPTPTPTPTASPSPTVAGTSRPQTLPPGAHREAGGFAWATPKGWRRDVKTGAEVHYTSPDGTQELAALSSLARGDLMDTWKTSEQNAHQGQDYRKIRLEDTEFQGHPAVVWEYTFTLKGVPWHARLLGFNADGKSYQVNTWYQPQTETQALKTYEKVKKSFTVL